MVEEINKIDIGHTLIELRKDGLVEVLFKESATIREEECLEIMDVYEKLLGKKKHPLLHLTGEYTQFTKSAREFGASEEGLRFSAAEAYVINSLAHKLLANFYMKVNKPSVPTKFFSNKDDAEEWLRKFL